MDSHQIKALISHLVMPRYHHSYGTEFQFNLPSLAESTIQVLWQVVDDLLHLVLERYPVADLVQIVAEEMVLDLVYLVNWLVSFFLIMGLLRHEAAS